jgi:hypothetical protein
VPIIKSTSEVDGEQIDIYIEVDEAPQVPDSDNPYQDVRETRISHHDFPKAYKT